MGEMPRECPTCGAPAERILEGAMVGEPTDHPTLGWRFTYARATSEPLAKALSAIRQEANQSEAGCHGRANSMLTRNEVACMERVRALRHAAQVFEQALVAVVPKYPV